MWESHDQLSSFNTVAPLLSHLTILSLISITPVFLSLSNSLFLSLHTQNPQPTPTTPIWLSQHSHRPNLFIKFFHWASHQLNFKHSHYAWNLVVDLLGLKTCSKPCGTPPNPWKQSACWTLVSLSQPSKKRSLISLINKSNIPKLPFHLPHLFNSFFFFPSTFIFIPYT